MNLAPASHLILAITSLCLSASLRAQDSLPAIALRRFAEALEGANLSPARVVACRDSGYRVVAVVGLGTEEVVAIRRRLGTCYQAYGPYVTVVDQTNAKAVSGCVHDQKTSNAHPSALGPGISFVMRGGPPSTVAPQPPLPPLTANSPICPESPFLTSEIQSMTLVTRLTGGRVYEMQMGPEVDAIFLSLPAIDKFMVPYYARVLGPDSAATMRQQIVRGLSR